VKVTDFTGLQTGETVTGVVPNDGTLDISSGTALYVGSTDAVDGIINATFTTSTGRTLNMTIDVSDMRQVGRRTFIANTLNTSYTQQNIRQSDFATEAMNNFRVVIPNFYMVQGFDSSPEKAAGSATITAAIEYPSGTFTQLTFGGSATLNQAAFDISVSDPVALSIPAGAVFYTRIFRVCAGGVFLSNFWSNANGSVCELGTGSLTDKTMGGTLTQGLANQGWAPVAIVQRSTTARTTCILGDSKSWGANVLNSGPGGGEIYPSLVKSGAPNIGILHLGTSGSQIQNLITGGTRRIFLARKYSKNWILQHGVNDLNAGRTAAQVLADRATIRAMGPSGRVWDCTITVTSTGTWGSYASQNVISYQAQRVSLNASIRALPLYCETADPVEDGRDTGRWRSPVPQNTPATSGTLTPDGVHYATSEGTNLIAASSAIDPTAVSLP
jgi:hypothetical protein